MMLKLFLYRFVLLCLVVAGILTSDARQASAQDSWAVYIYMCGSDLESAAGLATNNLNGLRSVQLPENVTCFIQTGGAKKWHTEGIPGNALGRYVYDRQGFREIARLEDASMGEEQTLEDFLHYAKENFPADRCMVVFWDHGGGSLLGFCRDEKYKNMLSLKDFRQALEAVDKANPEQPLFDLVAFDTCLMATLETANALHGYARYMVASEETMPGTGTDYAGWAGALARNPGMDGKELGTVICDTYLPYCIENKDYEMATLSLIDISKVPALNAAYEVLGKEAQREGRKDPRRFYTAFDRRANFVENYGGNGGLWTNMLDLGDLSVKLKSLDTAEAFREVLNEAVVCKVAGPYRQHGMGLAGYYCLDGRLMTLARYTPLPGASPAFADFYRDMLSGSGDGKTWYHFEIEKIANAPVVFDQENTATVTITPEEAESISEVDFLLGTYDRKGKMVYLGTDDRLTADWDNGIFRDDFDCTWPALNGHIMFLEIDEQQPEYILYHSFILLNGKLCYLKTAYDTEKKSFAILGAQRILAGGMLDREILQLHKGDRITLFFMNEEKKRVKGESFILEQEPLLQNEPLPDGKYAFAFRFAAPHNDEATSEFAYFVLEGGSLKEVGK